METSARMTLMGNIQAAAAEDTSGTMDERGRGFASDKEAWAELKDQIERTKKMQKNLEDLHKNMWDAITTNNADAACALLSEMERTARITGEEMVHTAALAKIAMVSDN